MFNFGASRPTVKPPSPQSGAPQPDEITPCQQDILGSICPAEAVSPIPEAKVPASGTVSPAHPSLSAILHIEKDDWKEREGLKPSKARGAFCIKGRIGSAQKGRHSSHAQPRRPNCLAAVTVNLFSHSRPLTASPLRPTSRHIHHLRTPPAVAVFVLPTSVKSLYNPPRIRHGYPQRPHSSCARSTLPPCPWS